MKTAADRNVRHFRCGYCGKALTRKEGLVKHTKRVHKDATYFERADVGDGDFGDFPAAGASKVDLMAFKRKAQGGKSSKEILIKKRRVRAHNALRKAENDRNQKKMDICREEKNAKAQAQELAMAQMVLKMAHMWQNLHWWAPWLDLKHEGKLARGAAIPKCHEGLNFLFKPWSTGELLMTAAFASDWQWQRVIPAQKEVIREVWNEFVHRKMGRLRKRCKNLFDAASYSWRGHTNGDDIRDGVMKLCNKKSRSKAFYDMDELRALSSFMKASVIVLRYSATPLEQVIVLAKECQYEPLVIANELGGRWAVLVRVLRMARRPSQYDCRGGCDRKTVRWNKNLTFHKPYSEVLTTYSTNDTDVTLCPIKVSALCLISNHEVREMVREQRPKLRLNIFRPSALDRAWAVWNRLP